MWASTLTRPDIAFAVAQCARFMSNPGPEHVVAARLILRYLAGTKGHKLTYSRQREQGGMGNRLWAYADADHAGDPESRRSVTGYLLMLNGGAVSWQSARQHVTALSTSEAEYYVASVAGTDVTYTRRLLEEFGHKQEEALIMMEDNMACIFMLRTSVLYNKVKHIDTCVYQL